MGVEPQTSPNQMIVEDHMATSQLCAAPGCDKPARQNRHNACSMHEARMRRGGSFEPRQPKLSFEEITGGRSAFGHWTVIGEGEPYQRKSGARRYGPIRTALCRCDCGTTRTIHIHTLKQGNSHHCGCRNGEKNAELHGTHLLSHSKEYRCWAKLKDRCLNPNDGSYADYGGRGITVCDRWHNSFEAFYEDMGAKPSKRHSIDRIDVNGNYEPGNCRWATPQEQAQNQRTTRFVELAGEKLALKEACRRIGAPYTSVHKRMSEGKTFAQAAARYLP